MFVELGHGWPWEVGLLFGLGGGSNREVWGDIMATPDQ